MALVNALIEEAETGFASDTRQSKTALFTAIATLEADAARYRFLRPFLDTDGEVDCMGMASRFYSWLRIKDETIPLPDALGWNSVDEAIDAAISSTPPGTDGRQG